MIPQIQEINFPSYATLHQATVSLQEMGERVISTQVRIDGDVVPTFSGWELNFKGERFILPTSVPQAAKDNTTRNALVDLNFTSWIISELKRYYFMSLSQIDANTAIADQYKASVILPLKQFVELFNRVLKYYFGDSVRMDLFQPDIYSTTPIAVEINYTHIWDLLTKFYELFKVRWSIVVENGVYVIKVGYAADSIEDHDFEYGYDGGLLRFERQVQDESITNVLLGRGGEKNLPYRYFKLIDPDNQEWEPDPDAIPELANIYFDRLRDAAFRWYVRGWMKNPNRDTSWDGTHTFPTYSDIPDEYKYAYNRGRTDEKFNPVEFVKDDDSIAKYGEHWGALDDNDEIYPTIQGVTRDGVGRVDAIVDVSEITTDDIQAAASEAATVRSVGGTIKITNSFDRSQERTDELRSERFTIPEGSTGNLYYEWLNPIAQDGSGIAPVTLNTTLSSIKVVNTETGTEYDPAAIGGIPDGTYYAKITVVAKNNNTSSSYANVTYGLKSLSLTITTPNLDAWKPTFDVWVKNIWGTEKSASETDEQYASRVWEKILGDRVGNEAKIVFSDGFMSISEDYEFQIASYPVVDRSKTFIDSDGHTYQSEWKITLRKSDAEFEATGLFIPNASASGKPQAGDHFFFIGIDMPFQYVEWAEEQVHASKLEPLQGTSDINPTWVINLDKVRVHTIEEADYGTALADRLAAGATVWIKDKRFTPGERLQLFVQSITYTWNEPTDGSPYLVPDIEVVLSDKVNASEGVVQKLQGSVDVIRSTYAKTSDLEAVVRRVATPLFLKKTGENDSSESPTTFSSKLSSKNFIQGDIGGAGWGFYRDGDDESVLELDKVVVRHEMRVNNLVSNQISYVGGKQITSAASIECTQVVDSPEGYYCYFDQKNGTVANLFVVGDIAMVQDFNPENVELRYYRARVDEVGLNYILLSKTVTDGDGEPKEGDTIIQYGNYSDPNRQYVIIRDVIGGGYDQMLSGLDSVNSNGDEYYFAGARVTGTEFVILQDNSGKDLIDKNGLILGFNRKKISSRWFVGRAAGEYAEWENGELTIKGRILVRGASGNYADISYLQSALPEYSTTQITNALVLSTFMGVKDENNTIVAAMNGSTALPGFNHGDTVMFAAGITNIGSASEEVTATTKIYASGKIVSGDVDLEGRIVATSGKIGPFSIGQSGIITVDEVGVEALSTMKTTGFTASRFPTGGGTSYLNVVIGTTANRQTNDMVGVIINHSRSSTIAGTGRQNTGLRITCTGSGMSTARGANISAYGATNNYGLVVSASGGTNNYAIYSNDGIFAGLRPQLRVINDSSSTTDKILTYYDFTIVVANTASITLSLPATPREGQTYMIYHITTTDLYIAGGGNNIIMNFSGAVGTTYYLQARGLLFLTWTKEYWVLDVIAH